MNIIDNLLTPGLKHGRPGTKRVPEGICLHYVGNPGSSAQGNRNYFQNGSGGLGVSAHYIVGLNGEVLRCLPDDEIGYHAGKSYGPQWNATAATANSKYIGIECCHPGADGKFNDSTYASVVALAASLCKKYGFGIDRVFRHYDVCGKSCPLYYARNLDEWIKLKNSIAARLSGTQAAAPPASASASPQTAPKPVQQPLNNDPSSWAKDAWDWAKSNGYNDGTRPRDNTTREEVAAFMWRVLIRPGGKV